MLTVSNGNGGGTFLNGTVVEVSANEPAEGMVFHRWAGTHIDALGSVTSSTTTFTMPSSPSTLIAVYRPIVERQISSMKIGTNFFYLAPDWTLEKPWASDIQANPWTNGQNVWNPAFLDDNAMYACYRPMQWNAVNPLQGSTNIVEWSQRRMPDASSNFSGNAVGTGSGPGLAYEWQIDLCNRMDVDYWVTLPVRVDDNYIEELAKLIKRYLNPHLKVYVELANEIWNYEREQAYAWEQGDLIGLRRAGDDNRATAMRWQAYRSAQMWTIFEEVWGDESTRVINVLAGWSTNPALTESVHLKPLFSEEGFNPTGALPEAYAIAPYFGGNGLPGDDPNVFDLLRTDIFEHRWSTSAISSRLKNVQDQYAIVKGKYGIDLIAYEGGQHIETVGRDTVNRDERMYDLYIDYLDAMAPYFSLFAHYVSVASHSFSTLPGGTGSSRDNAPKYRAIRDWIQANPYVLTWGPGAVDNGEHHSLSWFGDFILYGDMAEANWIFHFEHGFWYILAIGDDNGGIFIWTFDQGWLYTSESIFRNGFLYHFEDGVWMFYLKGSGDAINGVNRWVCDFSDPENLTWEEWGVSQP